jgi:hypothetical protein
MLNRWIHRLVRSEARKHKLLRKPRVAWPALLQTGDQGRLQILYRKSFPDRIKIHVELKPTLITQKDITACASLDAHECLPTSIYAQLNGDLHRVYGRCSSIALNVKDWHAVLGDKTELELERPFKKTLYKKEFFTVPTSIVEPLTVVNHHVVNHMTKRQHIYPYGGYLGPDGEIGDALYMSVTSSKRETTINIHSYSQLQQQEINLFEPSGLIATKHINPQERQKILPLQVLIQQGEIECRLITTHDQDEPWIQGYQSESLIRKEGTYEAFITFRRKGKPEIRSTT